mgnify:CR=1 FL=1
MPPKNQSKAAELIDGKKPLPMSWVVIAILLYMLFQVSYLAYKPQQTISESRAYDRTLLTEKNSAIPQTVDP